MPSGAAHGSPKAPGEWQLLLFFCLLYTSIYLYIYSYFSLSPHPIARVLQKYIGFSKFSFGEPGFLREICRWAVKRVNQRGLTISAIQRRDGQEIRSWEDLVDLGFEVRYISRYTAVCCPSNAVVMQVSVLHTSSFAFNCRVLDHMETRLHREFHSSCSRLWMKRGTGSYYMSEAAL